MGLPHEIFMTDLRAGYWRLPPPWRFAPIPEPLNEPDIRAAGGAPPASQCPDPVKEESALQPELDKPIAFSQCLTNRTMACRIFGAELVTTGHPPVLLS